MSIPLLAATNALALSQGTVTMLITGVTVYMVAMLVIGFFSCVKVKEMNDFLVAGRRLPFVMATATLLATWFGAGSSMGVAAKVYSSGIGGVIADPFGASLSLILAGFFIVGMLREKQCFTVTDIIERAFGKGAGIYATCWMLPVYVGWLGSQLLGLGTILNLLIGIDVMYGTLIGTAVVLLYTCAGGMWAVTLTDVVQVVIMFVGLVMLLPGTVEFAGGWEPILANLNENDSLLPIGAENVNDYVYYLGNWMIMGLGCMVGQDLIQRSLACKDGRIACRSSVVSGFLYLLIAVIPIIVGVAARVILPEYGITAETMGDNLDNQVLPRIAIMVMDQTHPVLLTIFIAALSAAIMSSADSSLLAGASLFCNNVLSPLFPKISNKNLLKTTRITTVVLTAVALSLAIWVKSIYDLMINSWISQLVVILLPVLMALYMPKATRLTAWVTMLAGTVGWLGYTFIVGCLSEFSDRVITCGAVYGFAAALAGLVICYFCERIFGKKDETVPTE